MNLSPLFFPGREKNIFKAIKPVGMHGRFNPQEKSASLPAWLNLCITCNPASRF